MKQQIDSISNQKNLNTIKDELANLLKIDLKDITWKKKGTDYVANRKNKIVYQESDQHVTAASKLMRVPKQLWLAWMSAIVMSTDKPVDKLPLKKRLQLFKKTFSTVIEPYYEEKVVTKKPKLTACFNCGTKEFKESYSRTFNGEKYWVYICANCGLGIRFPKGEKEDLEAIYSHNEYFAGDTTNRGYFNYDKEAPWRIKKAKDYLQKLEKATSIKPKTTYALDIGSGYGYFLKALNAKKYKNLGIELSPEAVDISINKYKTNTITGTIEKLYSEGKLHDNQFDLITLWDVIEHFYDFNEELELLSKILKPGGYIALRTNNIKSIEYDVFGRFFHSIKDEHTFYYNRKNLKEIFKKFNIKEHISWTHTHMFLAFMNQKERNDINKKCLGGDIFFVGKKS